MPWFCSKVVRTTYICQCYHSWKKGYLSCSDELPRTGIVPVPESENCHSDPWEGHRARISLRMSRVFERGFLKRGIMLGQPSGPFQHKERMTSWSGKTWDCFSVVSLWQPSPHPRCLASPRSRYVNSGLNVSLEVSLFSLLRGVVHVTQTAGGQGRDSSVRLFSL